MRTVDSDVLTALAKGELQARNFIWMHGKDDSNVDHTLGLWDDIGTITANYIDIDTGGTSSRVYVGTGTLLSIDDIPLTSDISVRTINVNLSQVNSTVINMVRGYNVRGGAVEIHRGLFNPGTFLLVAPAVPRFVGFIDTMTITDPTENNEGSISLSLVSHTRELTRTNTDVCSDASQKLRSATDTFYQDVATVGTWQIYWGEKKGTVQSLQPLSNTPPPIPADYTGY